MGNLALLDAVAQPALHKDANALAPHRTAAAHVEAEQRIVARRRRVELGATWIEDGTGGLFITRVRDPAAAERAAPAVPPAAPAAGRLPITGGQGCAVM